MRHRFVVVALALFATAMVSAQSSQPSIGLYSRTAVSIWGATEAVIKSPDGKSSILVEPPNGTEPDETHTVTVRANEREYRTRIGLLVNAEAEWSQDSRAFFLTYSDGGNVGTYHVKVVYVTESGIRMIEPVPDGRKLLIPKCFDSEFPNVGAVKWVGAGSERLLIAVEVPPHSSCASMGTFRSFEIALPTGKVVATYNQIEAKRLFAKSIGDELRGADDICIENPQACVPQGLVPKSH